jgi:glycosyltransferase involved in cell wall biosynthesis
MEPEFTIVTPSFRMLDWLKLCVASVADQHGPNVEHIIQDAGTGAELDAWAATQPAIRIYQEPDKGMYDAINRGLRRGHGRICAFLNCDEQYLPGALAKVRRYFDEHPHIDVLFGDVILVDVNGRAVSYRRVVPPNRIHTRLVHLGAPSCATFFRRKIVERGLLFDENLRSVGDAVWIDSLLEHKVPMASLREPLAVYTFTGMNDSESENPAKELRKWRAQPNCPARWQRLPAIVWHRLRKLAAGAYLPRWISYSIYTHGSPTERVRFQFSAIHFGWPGATAPPIQRREPVI